MSVPRHILTAQVNDTITHVGALRYVLWQPPEIDMTNYDRYVVTESDLMRLDLIAHRVYGDSSWWWVIAWVNNVFNPLRDLVVGDVLLLPKMEAISSSLAPRVSVR